MSAFHLPNLKGVTYPREVAAASVCTLDAPTASIDTEMLLRISIVLRHDFFRYYTAETTGRQENSTLP